MFFITWRMKLNQAFCTEMRNLYHYFNTWRLITGISALLKSRKSNASINFVLHIAHLGLGQLSSKFHSRYQCFIFNLSISLYTKNSSQLSCLDISLPGMKEIFFLYQAEAVKLTSASFWPDMWESEIESNQNKQTKKSHWCFEGYLWLNAFRQVLFTNLL